ncbi:MAG TPA: Vms1/Ankzf1 family peptidyl-tRNA hydrolase [Chloroflexota bacterium]|nr:Vms1/Ankzf1 family peptidyl-tRNA hydrolase [Chloroflexota bacterium]
MRTDTGTTHLDVTTLPAAKAVDALRGRLEGDHVLSAYLDTSPQRTDGPGWLLTLRDHAKELRDKLADPVAEGFEAAVQLAERFLTDAFVPTHPGIALFSTESRGAYVVNLPYRPVEGVVWMKGARIEPLVAALDDFERVAVALLDKEDARLYTVFLGEIEARLSLTDYVPGKQATGGWFGLSQTRYARHHEDHVHRHVSRTIDALLDLDREYPFDRLLVGGPDEIAAMLRRKLPSRLRGRLAGSVSLPMFASERDVLDAARRVAEDVEREHEIALVSELLDSAGLKHTAIGLDDVLAALADGRVHELLVAESFDAAGAECQVCHRLLPARDRCVWCDAPTITVPDLREQVVRRALDQGASIEIVRGEAASKLNEQGGMGAWTRF